MGHQQPHKICIIDGIRFASESEGRRYTELKYMKKVGIISDFECQPKFVLDEAFRKCPSCNEIQEHVPGSQKKMHTHCRKCGEKMEYWDPLEYFADFKLIYPDGKIQVEDVKGSLKFLDPVFKQKWRMWERQHPGMRLQLVVMPPVRKKKMAMKVPSKSGRRK